MPGLAIVIVADDLTGALDASAPFAMLGMASVTAIAPAFLAAAIARAPQVLAVNLGTRELGAEEAQARATAAARALQPFVSPGTVWLKKIDSRLKGPVAAEVAGVADVLRPDRVLLCPAIPQLGRIVRQGHLEGNGVAAPILVRGVLPASTTLDTPDALCDGDLDRMVAAAAPGTLFAGARGLAAALARRLCPGCPPAPVPGLRGPLGFMIGSRDPVTLAQVALLRQGGGPRWVAAPDGVVPPLQGNPAEGGPPLVQATTDRGATAEVVSQRLAKGMLAHAAGLRTLVVTGGETAAALLHAAGAGVLHIAGEVLPGLPLCHALDAPDFPALVTKSGGFGDPDCLLRLWRAAHSEKGLT